MKRNKIFLVGLMVLGLVVCSGLSTGPVMAAGTMQEVINALAASLNMPAADLVAILYPGGFDGAAPATEASIAQLYVAVNNAIIGGQISGNAATLVTNAAIAAGVSGDIVTGGITSGTTLSAAAGARGGAGGTGSGGFGGAGGGGGGGGGGAVSPSR